MLEINFKCKDSIQIYELLPRYLILYKPLAIIENDFGYMWTDLTRWDLFGSDLRSQQAYNLQTINFVFLISLLRFKFLNLLGKWVSFLSSYIFLRKIFRLFGNTTHTYFFVKSFIESFFVSPRYEVMSLLNTRHGVRLRMFKWLLDFCDCRLSCIKILLRFQTH